jgi:TnpA family transposase
MMRYGMAGTECQKRNRFSGHVTALFFCFQFQFVCHLRNASTKILRFVLKIALAKVIATG